MLLRLRAYENFANKLPYDDEIFQKFKMVRTKAINNKYRFTNIVSTFIITLSPF